MRALPLLLLGALAAPVLLANAEAVVCIGGTSVVEVRLDHSSCHSERDLDSVLPSDSHRTFVRLIGGSERVEIGEIEAGQASLPANSSATVWKFSVTSSEIPVSSVFLTIQALEGAAGRPPVTWSVELPRNGLTKPRELALPHGAYRLALRSEAYLSTEVEIDASAASSLPLRFVLQPLPRIEGRVLMELGGGPAALHDEKGRPLGLTQPDGSFSFLIRPDEWPVSVTVTQPDHGIEVVRIPPGPSVFRLADIHLTKGGRVVIVGDAEEMKAIESFELLRLGSGRQKAPYRKVQFEGKAATEFAISQVAPGRYVAIVSGAEPLEKFAATVQVKAGEEVRLPVALDPLVVEFAAFSGEEPLADADLMIESFENQWNSRFRLNGDGRRKLNVWQPGEVVFILESAQVTGYGGQAEIAGDYFEIRVPDAGIEGRVVDVESEQPVADIVVLLRGRSGGTTTKTSQDGSFVFSGVRAGPYTLRAGGVGGFSVESLSVEVSENGKTSGVVIALKRQPEYEVEVVDSRGLPAADALVVELSGYAVLSVRRMDVTGRARLPLATSGAERSLIVMHRDGTFFARHLGSVLKDASVRVTIPPPVSSLVIAIQAKKDKTPIEGISLAMRFNGVFFPIDIMQQLESETGARLRSGPDGLIRIDRGPSGMYEFWAVRSQSDVQALQAGYPPPASVILPAGPGQSSASLFFERVINSP